MRSLWKAARVLGYHVGDLLGIGTRTLRSETQVMMMIMDICRRFITYIYDYMNRGDRLNPDDTGRNPGSRSDVSIEVSVSLWNGTGE